ncbi:MAG: beta-ketoacyl synthase N-terminal-like domain-containing protein [Polyangiaceae bacterium]
MVLGEGAAVLALVRADRASTLKTRVHGFVRGFGASADAVHLTAPDRTGAGSRAPPRPRSPTQDLGERDRYRERARDRDAVQRPADRAAIRRALGDVDAHAKVPVLHAFKAQVGHTLGAAGALELHTSVLAIERGVFPATPITSELEPDLPGRVLAASEGGSPHLALKLSAAFGGANASLVVSDEVGAAPARVRRPAFVGRAASSRGVPSAVELASKLGVPVERFARADALVRAAIAACASLCESDPSLRGATATGVVVGHALATVETNASFDARRRERGPRAVEPRKFPYTSPNAVAGECGAFFGWNGPGLAVGAGLHGAVEALAIAATLVEAGDAERVVVVGVDELGATSRALADALGAPPRALYDGAVAVVVSADPGRGGARVAAISLGVDVAAPADPSAALGHRALLPLTDGAVPPLVAARCPSGAYAEVRLEPGAHRE